MSTYSFKEKRYHFDQLLSEEHANIDLELLKKRQPDTGGKFANLSGIKLAKEVLYLLLDHATREDIIANRRSEANATGNLETLTAIKDLIFSIIGKSRDEAVEIKDSVEALILKLPEADGALLLESLASVMATLEPANSEGASDENADKTKDENKTVIIPQAPNADDDVNGEGVAASEAQPAGDGSPGTQGNTASADNKSKTPVLDNQKKSTSKKKSTPK